MARLNKGILDDFSGKVGKVIGSSWRGIAYMRSIGRKTGKAKTLNQEIQQAKFKTASSFGQSMHDLFELGFKDYAQKMTGTNYAQSIILKEAIIGDHPDFKIDYSKVQVSKGKLTKAKTPAVAPGAAGAVVFTWTSNAGQKTAKANDQSILVAYCPELNETMFVIGATRDTGTASFDVADFSGKAVQTWLSFITANGKLVADSTYLGEVTVA
ncbi:hypothetical protein A4H97_32065 [Niastella yeongjuensis]|uniref:Uncharacterized protein n=1 Tax=Niastella yeongjuensis TaxID=354355 RepID=A0A1V9EIB5_9BACT|nr:DUF6266 family protein [Niastella yeongjuensis]OQP45878.1 hypothetical protein A4H97_32065 [Niastella yeongjuensis]SEP46747.1 hypothetical protein SAMN05660816_06495 [Niastella yeongjuensis]